MYTKSSAIKRIMHNKSRANSRCCFCAISLLLFASHASVTSAKMCEVIFIIGLEGVGHHGLGPVFSSLLSQARNKAGARHMHRMKKGLNYSEAFRAYAETCEKEKKGCVTFGGGSFPNSRSPFTSKLKSEMRWQPNNDKHWKYLNSTGHPINIERYYRAGREFCDLKFILLHRNLVDTVWAHRTWDTGVRGHSLVLSMFAQYIDHGLQKLPETAWKRIDYEDFWSNQRDDILKDLCKFLDWDVPNVTSAFIESSFRLSVKSRARIPCSVVRYIESEERKVFSQLRHYSNIEQHLGHAKELSTYARDSPRRNPRCYTTVVAAGQEVV